jgi:DHA1 family multidrug resistance protein-like MFS transporter
VSTAPSEYPYWRHNRYALPISAFFQSIGFGLSNPFLPLVLREMGVVDNLETWVGYLIGIYFTLSFTLTPVWGAVADHYGRKLMVLRTSLGMGLVYALLPFMPSLPWFLFAFLLLATTNGLIPACQALMATTTPGRLLPSSLALLQTGALVGGTLGPALGAVLAGWLPAYRDLFWAASGFTLLAGTVALLFARERFTRPEGALELHPVRDLGTVLRLPGVPALLAIYLTYQLTYNGSVPVVSVFTLHLLEDAGVTDTGRINTWVGAVSVALPVGSALAVPVWGRLLDRFGPGRLLPLCLGAGAAGVLLQAAVFTTWQLAAARLVLGLLAVGIGPAAIALIRGRAPAGMESRVLAYLTGCGMIGMGAGPFLAGQIGPLLGLRAYFLLNCALVLLGLFLWRRANAVRPPVVE